MSRTTLAVGSDIAEIVRTGRIRVAVYPPTYAKDALTGALSGWTIDVINALGERLGIKGQPVERATPPEAVASLRAGDCEVAMLGIEPSRAAFVDYSAPLVELDYTVLVAPGCAALTLGDLDQPGRRIAAVRNHASTLALERKLTKAQLVYADMLEPAFDILRSGKADAFASVVEIVAQCGAQVPGARVLDGRYGSNLIGMAVPKGNAERHAFICAFANDAKASGLVQRGLDRIGWRGARVAAG